jgi:hypothetical protein
MDERLVALHINHHVGPQTPWQGADGLIVGRGKAAHYVEGLANAVGAALVGAASHHYAPAEDLYGMCYALVVGSHPHFVNHFRYAFYHSLYHRLATKQGKRLARKARGSIPGRNYRHEFHVAKLAVFYEIKALFPRQLALRSTALSFKAQMRV